MGKAARKAREQKMGCETRPLKMTPSDRRSLAHLDKTCPNYNKAPNSTYEEFMRHMGMGSGGGFDGHVWCQKGGEIADPGRRRAVTARHRGLKLACNTPTVRTYYLPTTWVRGKC